MSIGRGLDAICSRCGRRMRQHRSRDSRCPGRSGLEGWDADPEAVFMEAEGSHADEFAEVCGRCGCSRGAHSTAYGVIRCPEAQHRGGSWTMERFFVPTGRYDPVFEGMRALDLSPTPMAPPPERSNITPFSFFTPLEAEPGLDEICGGCGERYGRHQGPQCPDGMGNFVRLMANNTPSQAGREEGGSAEVGWILVAGNEDRMQRLCAAGVTAAMATIVRPFELRGIVFPETELQRVKETGIVRVYDTLVPTSTEGVRVALSQGDVDALAEIERGREEEARRIGTETEAGRYVVSRESDDNMEYWDGLEPVLKDYAGRMKKNIKVLNCHAYRRWDNVQPPDGTLRILFWAAVKFGDPREYPFVFGITLPDGQHDGMVMEGRADYEIRSYEGEVVGQVVGNTLFVAFDLPHGNLAGEVMAKILDAYMKVTRTEMRKKLVRNSDEAKIELMNRLLMASVDNSIRVQKEALASKFGDINYYTNAVSNLLREAAGIKQILKALEEKKEKGEKNGEKVLSGLLGLEHVKDVVIAGDTVTVDTDHMDFMYKGGRYVGRAYKIKMSPAIGMIVVVSGDSTPLIGDGYVHPHVNTRGIPCLGNIKIGAYQFLTAFEFVPLTELLIQYLQMANETDWYKDPSYWPKVKGAEGNKEQKVAGEAVATVVEEPETRHRCGDCGGEEIAESEWCSECGYCIDCCKCGEPEDDYDDYDNNEEEENA